MTKSYNAFIIKQVDNIIKNLKEYYDVVIINNKPVNKKYYIYIDLDVKIRRQYILTFVMCLKHVLNEESPKIKELSSYLDNLVKICTRLQMPIPWNLPSGAFIKESYLIFKEVPIKAFTFLKTRYTFRTFIKGVYDLKKQKRALMPNIIHSLDATTIALLYKDWQNIGCLYTVHDCFATTANLVPLLINSLKFVYIRLYSDTDYLIQFDELVKTNINKQFGDKVYNMKNNHVCILTQGKDLVIQLPDINKVLNLKGYEKDKINNLVKSSYTII